MADELQQPVTTSGRDWPAYYRHTQGRDPRPLFAKGMAVLAAAGVEPGQAVEIGFGDGTETLILLGAGWRVAAVDPTPAAADALRDAVVPGQAERLEILTSSAESARLPPFDLLYACNALSFVRPGAFRRFWRHVRAQLRPGGFLVVNVFGVGDSWAKDPDMTFVARDEVFRMVQGLEIIALDEEDQDGESFSGPKHWHIFDIVARRQPGNAE